MLAVLTRRLIFGRNIASRTFLSNAYNCQDQWENRRQSPAFNKIDYEDLYHQLDRHFQIGLRISALDVDLFVNGIDSDFYQNELEDIIYKLRLNPESSLLRDRTMHAVIRYYMTIGKKQELINILSNRLSYGIFPDYFASNMLMDAFLKEQDTISAVKIAVLQMLQEDFNHPILKSLSLHSCYKYLYSSDIWSPPKEPEVDPDEDEIKVRVSYLRTPYHDDHFDIVNPNHLVGKTLYLAGKEDAGPLGLSSQVIGLSLYEKRKQLKDLLVKLKDSKNSIHEEAINKAIEYTQNRPKKLEGEPLSQDTDEIIREKEEVLTVLEKSKQELNMLPGDLETVSASELTKSITENEKIDIGNIIKLYKNWEKEREDHINEEIFESQKKKAMEEIAATKVELTKEEEVIYFFDKEDEWELKVESKQVEIDALATEQSQLKKVDSNEEYIPPDVHQKRN